MRLRNLLRAFLAGFIVFLFCSKGYCQKDVVQGPDPIDGTNQLISSYYRINFTNEQRKLLKNIVLEFIYDVDVRGNATLVKINGISNPVILDSLSSIRLPEFLPRTVNGIPEPSFYFLRFQYPVYSSQNEKYFQPYNNSSLHSIDDLEFYDVSGQGLEVGISGFVRGFMGSASDYLGFGGGFAVDMTFINVKGTNIGIVMNMAGNGLKKQYPIVTTRPQQTAPPTLLLGVTANKTVAEYNKHALNIQGDICYAIQNVVTRSSNAVEDYVQFKGASVGLGATYFFKLGKDKLSVYYGRHTIVNNNFGFHMSVRPVFYNQKEANGVMVDVGIIYKLRQHFIESFKVKTP